MSHKTIYLYYHFDFWSFQDLPSLLNHLMTRHHLCQILFCISVVWMPLLLLDQSFKDFNLLSLHQGSVILNFNYIKVFIYHINMQKLYLSYEKFSFKLNPAFYLLRKIILHFLGIMLGNGSFYSFCSYLNVYCILFILNQLIIFRYFCCQKYFFLI